ncbi:hypothetical protein FB446DRAFT_707250 [Lentinula raphanica]|nr:hypothetical protein FB446DRAFT_707250 [Lentinula raphanica]
MPNPPLLGSCYPSSAGMETVAARSATYPPPVRGLGYLKPSVTVDMPNPPLLGSCYPSSAGMETVAARILLFFTFNSVTQNTLYTSTLRKRLHNTCSFFKPQDLKFANSSLLVEDKTTLDFQLIFFSGLPFLRTPSGTCLIKLFQTILYESRLLLCLLVIMRFTPYASTWLVLFVPLPLMCAMPVYHPGGDVTPEELRVEVDGKFYHVESQKEVLEIKLPEESFGNNNVELPVRNFVEAVLRPTPNIPQSVKIMKDDRALVLVPRVKEPPGVIPFQVRAALVINGDIQLHEVYFGGWLHPDKYKGKLEPLTPFKGGRNGRSVAACQGPDHICSFRSSTAWFMNFTIFVSSAASILFLNFNLP